MAALIATTDGFSNLWPLLVLMLSFIAPHVQAQDPTTVPIFLPAYKATEWSRLRGSIVSSNDAETLYTIFCSPSTRTVTSNENYGGCAIAKIPFTFLEGPSTMHYEQNIGSDFAITQACILAGTTAATCSASTSAASSFSLGPLRGPFDTAQGPVTLTGTAVQWGVLTLAQPPLTSTVSGSRIVTYYPPSSTSTAGGGGGGVSTPTPTVTSEESTGPGVSAVETGSGNGSVVSESAGTSGSSSTSDSAGPSASTIPSGAARSGGSESWLAATVLLGGIASILL
ncbi:serine palmitoyltransferase component [Hypoxylon texense]